MRLCHRFGLKRVTKLLMLRDERHRSFFLFLAVLRAVVQWYVKNRWKRHTVANDCRLLPRRDDAKLITQLSSCRKPKFNDRSCVNLDAMLTTQFSLYCKREVKINMHSLRSINATPPTGFEPVTSWLTVTRSSNWAMANEWWPNEKRIGLNSRFNNTIRFVWIIDVVCKNRTHDATKTG